MEGYSESSNRLLIMDTKGIACHKDHNDFSCYPESSSILSDRLIHLLDSLSRFEENKLWIISPDTKSKIEKLLTKIERYKASNTHNTGMSSKDLPHKL